MIMAEYPKGQLNSLQANFFFVCTADIEVVASIELDRKIVQTPWFSTAFHVLAVCSQHI